METLKINFDIEKLFNRVNVDILNRGEQMEQQLEMCEHDRAWFNVALNEAANIVLFELSRISKDIDKPLEISESTVTFETETLKPKFHNPISEAIERYLVSHITNQWFLERLGAQVIDSSKYLSQLKHITLSTNGASRKSYY